MHILVTVILLVPMSWSFFNILCSPRPNKLISVTVAVSSLLFWNCSRKFRPGCPALGSVVRARSKRAVKFGVQSSLRCSWGWMWGRGGLFLISAQGFNYDSFRFISVLIFFKNCKSVFYNLLRPHTISITLYILYSEIFQ